MALLDLAVSRLPGRYRRRLLVRWMGPGSPTTWANTSPPAAGVRGRGRGAGLGVHRRLVVHRHRDGRDHTPAHRAVDGRDRPERPTPSPTPSSPSGPVCSTHRKIPDLRITVRDEPGHPRLIVALAANLLACFGHLALPAGELRDAAPKLLRYRLLHLPARLTRRQRKRWLHLRADWPWTDDVINAWRAVKALPAPT